MGRLKKIKIIICLWLLIISLGCKPAGYIPDVFHAKVVRVKDGDTVEVLYKKQYVTIRLEHIDCPERKQPYHQKAKSYSEEFCVGKRVKIISKRKYDRYKRLLAEIEYKSRNLNKELVASGLALHYKRYSKDSVYAALEQKAHKLKLGMWAQEKMIAPWLFRKRKKG